MRLTLRTLLAYLDDVLSPEDTKVIGQKIHDSPMAQLLVSRIREVMRRRRLKAPEFSGPEIGIDPNVVSQYLDNTLPSGEYAEVERVLLASDELLAETASCHQVLALALGEMKQLSDASRERLYALGPVEASSKLATSTETDLEMKSKTPISISTPRNSKQTEIAVPEPLVNMKESATVIPDYLKPIPWWNRLVPLAVVSALVFVCLALLIPAMYSGLEQAKKEIKRNEARMAVPSAEAKRGLTNEPEADSNILASNSESIIAVPEMDLRAAGDLIQQPEGLDPPPPNDEPDEIIARNAPLAHSSNAADERSIKTKISPKEDESSDLVPPSPALDTTPPAEPPTEFSIAYNSTDGILIRREQKTHHWLMVPHKTTLSPGERIANVEPFDGKLEFEKANVRAIMVGECVLELMHPDSFIAEGINVGRGRMLLQSTPKTADERGTIGIKIVEDTWKLQLMSSDSVCALDVNIVLPNQFEKHNETLQYQASIIVVSGSAQWTNRDGKTVELSEFSKLEITPESSTTRNPPITLQAIPDWCDSVKRRNKLKNSAAATFEKLFEMDHPLEPLMLKIINDEAHPKIAGLAAHCLSAMDSYTALVETLATCIHEEARFAARDGLRQWLPINPDNGAKLLRTLKTHYPDDEAEIVYKLLWGFTREDVKSSLANSLQFTTWMSSSKHEIRELAEYWVKFLMSPQRVDYNALRNPLTREGQIKRLEEIIRRNNGLLKSP